MNKNINGVNIYVQTYTKNFILLFLNILKNMEKDFQTDFRLIMSSCALRFFFGLEKKSTKIHII